MRGCAEAVTLYPGEASSLCRIVSRSLRVHGIGERYPHLIVSPFATNAGKGKVEVLWAGEVSDGEYHRN